MGAAPRRKGQSARLLTSEVAPGSGPCLSVPQYACHCISNGAFCDSVFFHPPIPGKAGQVRLPAYPVGLAQADGHGDWQELLESDSAGPLLQRVSSSGHTVLCACWARGSRHGPNFGIGTHWGPNVT